MKSCNDGNGSGENIDAFSRIEQSSRKNASKSCHIVVIPMETYPYSSLLNSVKYFWALNIFPCKIIYFYIKSHIR